LAVHAPSAGEHDHPGHHHDHHDGHAHLRARPVVVVSALTMSAASRLMVAGGLAAVLWLLVIWAMV